MKKMSQRAGFSLIEVMCALLILGIALAGLTQGLSTALRSSKEVEVQTAAALLAAAQVETLRADGFVLTGETEGEGDGGLSKYRWRQNVTTTDVEGLYAVTVTVELAESGSSIYELETLLFDAPLTSETDAETRKESTRRKERRER